MQGNPHDASKKLIQFYIDEYDAARLAKYCARENITRQRFLLRLVLDVVADIELTDEEVLAASAEIAKRIAKGYNVPRKR